MSMSFGSQSKTTKQQQTQDRDPWDETIPYLQDFLKKAGSAGGIGASPDQAAAFDTLKTQAAGGNPWADKQAGAADSIYATPDRTGVVGDAYDDLKTNIGGYASGDVDPMSNPSMRAMLDQVGNEAQDRVSAMFAGAGRDLSGAHQQAVGRGVTQAQLPLLLDQYNKNVGTKVDAAKSLYSAGAGTASTQGSLDAQRANILGQGKDAAAAALAMERQGPTDVLNIEQQRKSLPYEDLARYGSILFPAATLGGQGEMEGTAKQNGTSFGFGFDILKGGTAASTLLSDERAKEAIKEVGTLADGTTIYRYRYKDDPSGTVHMGPMAQEVEERHPKAVSDDGPDGMKMVDMDAATRKAAEIMRARLKKRSG